MTNISDGETYPYYSCLGRHSKRTDCTLRSIQIEHAEDLIQDLYDRISLTPASAATSKHSSGTD